LEKIAIEIEKLTEKNES